MAPTVRQSLFLAFDSLEAFDRTFERQGAQTGIFHSTNLSLAVGDWVIMIIAVREAEELFSLEGRVLWRRFKSGGPNLPAGVFVVLPPLPTCVRD